MLDEKKHSFKNRLSTHKKYIEADDKKHYSIKLYRKEYEENISFQQKKAGTCAKAQEIIVESPGPIVNRNPTWPRASRKKQSHIETQHQR